MSVPAIPSTTVLPMDLTSTSAARTPVQTLGQDDFLKLLVTKMQSQDPMKPQGDEDFIAQMAQFSSLENSKSMQANLQSLTANGMIGRTVTIKGESTVNGQMPDITGVVNSVSIQNGSPLIDVNGEDYSLDRLLQISNPVNSPLPQLPTAIATATTPVIKAAA